MEDIERILVRFSWLNTPFIFFFLIDKENRKNKNKCDLHMKLGITVSFQDHSIWQTFMSILGWILNKLIYRLQKWQNFKTKDTGSVCLFDNFISQKESNKSAWNCLQKIFTVSFNFSFTEYRPFSSCSSIVWYN